MSDQKPIHTAVLDTGPIIQNTPSISTLLAQTSSLVTVPAIVSEIRDAATRARVETTLFPFLTLRTPKRESVNVIRAFARKTGDLPVLSNVDVQVLALAYELECERNGGPWRLRMTPNLGRMKQANEGHEEKKESDEEGWEVAGKPRRKVEGTERKVAAGGTDHDQLRQGIDGLRLTQPGQEEVVVDKAPQQERSGNVEGETAHEPRSEQGSTALQQEQSIDPEKSEHTVADDNNVHAVPEQHPSGSIPEKDLGESEDKADGIGEVSQQEKPITTEAEQSNKVEDSDSDSEEWITPSNLSQHQALHSGVSTQKKGTSVIQVGVLTTDFAMQNVLMQMNLNLLSSSLSKVKQLKTHVLRCHACFQVTKDMDKQFCPRCGQPALTRVTCSTNSKGEFQLHLKKNMTWNTRGNRYSVPKPTHGSAGGKPRGGGKGGWGHDLILAEDQKEYDRAVKTNQRLKNRDLMDTDYLPSILTGDRNKHAGGRIKVGAGKNVNSRKR